MKIFDLMAVEAEGYEKRNVNVLFENELLHDRINLGGITPITDSEYFVRGSTALLDAIDEALNKQQTSAFRAGFRLKEEDKSKVD